MKRYWHTREHLSYLDCLEERLNRLAKNNDAFETIYPEFFPEYSSCGEYHGIDITPRVLKRIFFCYMGTIENYLQKSFQRHADDRGSADFTYKTAKKVVPPGRKGELFKASYTKNSLQGKMELSRFTHMQGNDEIEPLIRDYRDSRINAGQPLLKRPEGDNSVSPHT